MYPSRSQVEEASYRELLLWYEHLPTPTNDLERRLLDLICQRIAEHELDHGERREGCIAAVIFLALVGCAVVAGGRM